MGKWLVCKDCENCIDYKICRIYEDIAGQTIFKFYIGLNDMCDKGKCPMFRDKNDYIKASDICKE